MKKRIIKKRAKEFLANPSSAKTHEIIWRGYTDGTYTVKTIASLPKCVADEVHRIARKSGWDGCHWDDPLLINSEDF